MKRRARLDHDLVCWGFDEVDELAEGEVDAGDGDLRPGAYRWNAEHGRFDPLPPHQVKAAPGAPTLEEAFYALVTQGNPSAAIAAWVTAYESTLEGKGK